MVHHLLGSLVRRIVSWLIADPRDVECIARLSLPLHEACHFEVAGTQRSNELAQWCAGAGPTSGRSGSTGASKSLLALVRSKSPTASESLPAARSKSIAAEPESSNSRRQIVSKRHFGLSTNAPFFGICVVGKTNLKCPAMQLQRCDAGLILGTTSLPESRASHWAQKNHFGLGSLQKSWRKGP